MNLLDIYEEGGFHALRELAEKANTDAQYLRQLATGWRGKKPGPKLSKRLIEADPRLTWSGLYADVDPDRARAVVRSVMQLHVRSQIAAEIK